MALRFLDSFDHYGTADLLMKWSSLGGASHAIQAAAGRRGGGCLRLTGSLNCSVTKTLDAQATWVIGMALNVSAAPGSATSLIMLLDAGTEHLRLRLNTDGTLSVLRGGSTVLGTSAASITFASFVYLELKATIHDSTGAYEVRINGANVLSASGVDTRNAGNSTANQIQLRSNTTPGGNYDFDDLYICDGTGSTNNDFLGDVRVDCYLPSGNGNSSQLTGSDGNSTDNYLLVDESAQNGDTDYVQTATATQKDTYAVADMTHTPVSIFGVQVGMIARKDDSGNRSIASVIRSGGSDTDGTTQALSTGYLCYMQISETDPATSSAWTKTGLNSAEFGCKCAA